MPLAGRGLRTKLILSRALSTAFRRASKRLLGGQWAGWECKYASCTGHLQPVPPMFLSQTMIEWGQIPSGFELLCSEQCKDGHLVRTSVRLHPEEGHLCFVVLSEYVYTTSTRTNTRIDSVCCYNVRLC